MAEASTEHLGHKRKMEAASEPPLDTRFPPGLSFLEAIMADAHAQPLESHPELRLMLRDIPHPVIENTTVDIIIREADWRFWEACVSELEDPNPRKIRKRVAVIGSPGIGKSTTALFLVRRLLQRRKTVVYKIKGAGSYVIFTPNGNGEESAVAIELPGTTLETQIDALRRQETYYIIDPGVTKTNCNPDPNVKSRVIIVASPDERHWGGNSFPKDQPGWPGGLYWYFPPWSLAELRAAGSLLPSPISSEDIDKLFSVFGGIPRQVLNPEYSKQNSRILKQKVEALSEAQAKNLVSGRLDIHANFGADQPQGGIAIFHPTDDYEDVTVCLASVSVQNWVRSHFMDAIWADLSIYPTPTAWQLLESYTSEAMMKTNEYTVRSCVGKLDALYAQTFQLELGGCASKSLQYDCSSAVKDGNDDVLFYSSSRTHPLYDMIFKRDAVYYAIQVTIGRTHPSKQQQIEELAHLLQIGQNGSKLILFYAVHEGLFDTFVTDPVRPTCPTGVSIYHLSLRQYL